jgi:hypothetical protein
MMNKKAKRGRPSGSVIRQNIVELLYVLGTAYGYNVSKIYQKVFPPATRRVIYYHLKKGISLGEFEIDKIEREQGEFSWGGIVEKTYYKLGKQARPQGKREIKEKIEQLK